jgi:hypothetical protein
MSDIKKLKNNGDCMELKSINYKNMLLKGTSLYEHRNTNDMNNLDNFLENEKKKNKNQQWSKLDKCEKIKKLLIFVSNYKIKNNLSDEEENNLISYFQDLLDKKLLQKVKDVIYDKENGIIKDIPGLIYNKQHKKFTIKNSLQSNKQNHITTLKTLIPKKKYISSTIKNIDDDNSNYNSSISLNIIEDGNNILINDIEKIDIEKIDIEKIDIEKIDIEKIDI